MMRRTRNDFLSFMYKPLCIVILLFGLFGLVWLRSNVVSISYDLRSLEEKKTELQKETKMLLADRAKVISLASIGSSFTGQARGDHKHVSSGYVFPDRVKVVHLKRQTRPGPYKVSLEAKRSK